VNAIHFELNKPQIFQLSDVIPDEHQGNWVYPTSDGRSLELAPHVGRKIAALKIEAGEEISIGRYQQIAGEPANWVICLTPRSEQSRAAKEREESERAVREQAEATRRDPAGQLAASIALLKKQPHSASQQTVQATESPKGTGTYGPALAPARTPRNRAELPPPRVSYRIAFREITSAVLEVLQEKGEQWTDQAKQDAVSTVFIAAAKAGAIQFDVMPEGEARS
jgi:hypothetical protein